MRITAPSLPQLLDFLTNSAQKPWIYIVYWELQGVPSPHSSPLMVLMLVNTP